MQKYAGYIGYIQVSTCNRLCAILTFVQIMACEVHLTCLSPDLPIGSWRCR